MTTLALLGLAWAGTPLLSAEPDRARWIADELEGQALEVVPIEARMAGKAPTLSGEGALLSCGGEPMSAAALAASLDLTEAALDRGDITEATARLLDDAEGLSCASEPVDSALIARLYLLRGRAALGRQQREAATADLAVALRLEPGLTWNPAWGDPAAWEAARATPPLAPSKLRIIPADGPIRVDGDELAPSGGALTLTPGPHVVQVGSQSWLLSVAPEGTARLVLPGRVSAQTLGLAGGDDEELADLGALIAVAYPEGEDVLIHSGRHVIGGEVGALEPLPIHPPGRTLMGSGTGLLVAGAVGAALTFTVGQGLWVACNNVADSGGTTEPSVCSADNEALYTTLRIVLPISEIAAGAGTAILTSGFWRRQAGFRPLPQAATVTP